MIRGLLRSARFAVMWLLTTARDGIYLQYKEVETNTVKKLFY
jgi:hypothetical protein